MAIGVNPIPPLFLLTAGIALPTPTQVNAPADAPQESAATPAAALQQDTIALSRQAIAQAAASAATAADTAAKASATTGNSTPTKPLNAFAAALKQFNDSMQQDTLQAAELSNSALATPASSGNDIGYTPLEQPSLSTAFANALQANQAIGTGTALAHLSTLVSSSEGSYLLWQISQSYAAPAFDTTYDSISQLFNSPDPSASLQIALLLDVTA